MNYSKPSKEVQRERADATYRSITRHLRALAESERQAVYDAIYGMDSASLRVDMRVAIGSSRFANAGWEE